MEQHRDAETMAAFRTFVEKTFHCGKAPGEHAEQEEKDAYIEHCKVQTGKRADAELELMTYKNKLGVFAREVTWVNAKRILHKEGTHNLPAEQGAAAFRAVAEGNSAALRELVPAYTEELKNADGSTLLAFVVAQLGPVDVVACAEMVDVIVSLPGFVLTVAGHDKDDKPAYLLAAELGLSAVVHAIISRCGSQQAIDVCGHEVPQAAAHVLAATLVECRAQIKNVNGLPLDEIRTAAPSGYVLDLSERLARDRSHVGAWTLGVLLREDQSYLKMESIAWSNDPSKYGIISADNIRSLIGLPGESAEVVLRRQIKGMQPALHFICALIAGSSSCTALDLSGKFCHSQNRQLSNLNACLVHQGL
ncbi:hypothetical protein CYMTET_43293 [Cymbomonas tetramitiformis]|uniref:Uncharacterized protein n=1 Tax=Cymbomonas tetramitiformis TaxID=36881 RepID=A0AAE0F0P5_9CHLO|nr:hypothetical protein CYMTET_43295 [Cymbomonas tetramitiformis]KAK3247201.1 hypothetical protein CYMTET_43293 [Cymbomonas tetramitiformis]